MKIYNFEEIDSTNDFAERIRPLGEDAVITARRQKNGHGSKGRSFLSETGGLYLTKLSFYEDFPASEVFRVMIDASVAVCKTMERFSLTPQIKWPNDVYVNGKKICGMLINNTFCGNNVSCSVVGIGVNIENELPKSLSDIAVTMKQAGAKDCSFERVRDALVEELQKSFSVEEYKKYIFFLGKNIFLLEGEKKREVVALDIDGYGRLKVKDGDKERLVTAAEVSLRLS